MDSICLFGIPVFGLFEFKISDIWQQLGYRTKLRTTGLMALPMDVGILSAYKIEVRKTPLFPKPLAKSAIVVYNQVRNRRILACPTVAQSETYKALSLLTDYRLSPIGVEDSLSVYLRLCLLSMYVKAANTTSKSVSTSKVSIPTSFPSPERTTARLSLLALI